MVAKIRFFDVMARFPAPWHGRYPAVARVFSLFSPIHGISQNPCIFPHATLGLFGR
ncbi:hypothetical protein SLEP1_g56784 [Rubroshorea leprosula]|uniref:Uncharacterized protein n=1 Tax=Rubroshorea leprosula TaxID=152421 RepID=A0AAV5MKT5_9ROSI|nr:hypothetical protein SLEP1_g56784 [Rubroshorea leprosula]